MGPAARRLLLKYLIFNDAMLMHLNHMNHNASDRASCYDAWLEYCKTGKGFADAKDRYDKHHPDLSLVADVTGYEPQEFPTEEIDRYAEEVVQEALPMLEKRLHDERTPK